jgi:general secretion pathway protein A
MYADFYGFRELPFSITPDPRFLYLNDCYEEALAALSYGVSARKGFISLVGEAGTGKTTLLRRLLDTLEPRTRSVLLLNPSVTFAEILEHILLELGIPTDGARKLTLVRRLNEFLLAHTAAGGNVVLLIDEAQDLSPRALEELRLLSNLETAREKILQIVLAGQPELEGLLGHARLRQLRQRVTLRVRVRPLTSDEVAAYVRARLERVTAAGADLFAPAALARVAALSSGIPRLINVLCDAALLAGFVAGVRRVDAPMVDEAWRDHELGAPPCPPPGEEVRPAAAPPQSSAAVSPPPAAPPAAVPEPPASPAPEPGLPTEPPPPPTAAEAAEPRSTLSVPGAVSMVAVLVVGICGLSFLDARLRSRDTAEQVATAAPPLVAAAEASGVVAPPPAASPGAGPVSSAEATALLDAFRLAYEARDVDRLVHLFAPDAAENGRHGHEAIAAAYRAALGVLTDVHYALPQVAVEARGERAGIRGPFVISYRQADGARSEIRGAAEWELERRDGEPRIVRLDYRLDGEG